MHALWIIIVQLQCNSFADVMCIFGSSCFNTAASLVTNRVNVSPDYYYRKNCADLKESFIASLSSDFHWRLLQLGLCGDSQSCLISKVEFRCPEQ